MKLIKHSLLTTLLATTSCVSAPKEEYPVLDTSSQSAFWKSHEKLAHSKKLTQDEQESFQAWFGALLFHYGVLKKADEAYFCITEDFLKVIEGKSPKELIEISKYIIQKPLWEEYQRMGVELEPLIQPEGYIEPTKKGIEPAGAGQPVYPPVKL